LAITASSVNKLKKDLKPIKKLLTTVNIQIAHLKEAESDISESEGEDEASHFQMDAALQFAQVDQEFEPSIAKLFKQACSTIKLDLCEVILLDIQSTMDLFCNAALVSKTSKYNSIMRLKRNGGTMVLSCRANMPGYNKTVWYESGLHYYDPRKEHHLSFINTVSKNKQGLTKRQIKGADTARNLYKTLSYPSMKYLKWVIRSNQIKDCPVTVQDIDVALKISGKNIAALKCKTTQTKSIPVARNYVKVPMELLNLQKEVFLTTDIIFVNKIPFFLMFSRKICFMAVNHLADRTVPYIFKSFK
jgi:hypothetical protein